MKRGLLLVLLTVVVFGTAGCAIFARKSAAAQYRPRAFALAVTVNGVLLPTPQQWAAIQAKVADELAAHGWVLVTDLALALEHPDTRTEAAEAIRGLIDAIVLTPADAFRLKPEATGDGVDVTAVATRSGRTPHPGALTIELRGNLAAVLSAAQNATRSPETGDLELQIAMAAGARNHLNMEFSCAAA